MPPLPARPDLLQCRACPRLAAGLAALRAAEPAWHNAPVPAWGDPEATVLLIGLAPGRRGANRTGRPFVGDPSGDWVQRALIELGALAPDGEPRGVRITNAVKCLPPKNRPTAAELATCRTRWLTRELQGGPPVLVTLGRVAHTATLDALGVPRKAAPFAHAARHVLFDPWGRTRVLRDSYHPSPLVTRTGRMSWASFRAELAAALADGAADPTAPPLTGPDAV